MNYSQYCKHRVSDLDKLVTVIPELMNHMEGVKKILAMDNTVLIEIAEGFRKNLSEILNRDIHPAECDVYLKLLTHMAFSSTMKELISSEIPTEDLFKPTNLLDKIIDKTYTNLGALIHGFDRDDVKKYIADVMHEVLSDIKGFDHTDGMFGDNPEEL